MKIQTYIIILLIAAVIAVAFMRFDGCGEKFEKLIVPDSTPHNVDIPPVYIRDTTPGEVRYLPAKADSAYLRALLAEMDSLRTQLQHAQVRSVFSMDTITAQRDTLRVDCDEISRSIALKVGFAPRQVMIQTEREVILQLTKPKYSIGVGIGGILTAEGQVKYGITATIQYNLITF